LESANSANEFTMQQALAGSSRTNFDIKDSLSQLGSTIGNITNQQQNLFSQVQYLTTTLAGTFASYEHLAHTNQQSAMLASEYSALILQTILTLDSLRKAQLSLAQ
jgi:cell shape-determining protein MreC